MYFIADKPTPLFNTGSLKEIFQGPLRFDARGLLGELEMIAFPGTVFEIARAHRDFVLEVRTVTYPVSYPIYIDERFGTQQVKQPQLFHEDMPTTSQVLDAMVSAVGLPYVWGGNIRIGVPEMWEYYPPEPNYQLTPSEQYTWSFHGLDCSGLLYEATKGLTPRNSSELLFSGEGVSIEGSNVEEIAQKLVPGDVVIYRGHLFIVLSETESIESKQGFGGVTITPTLERLHCLMEEELKVSCNDPRVAYRDPNRFLVRRFVF